MRVFFISIVLFYDYKSSKMGISKILNNLFIWFFFIIINFQKWVYKYTKYTSIFCLRLKGLSQSAPKHTTSILSCTVFFSRSSCSHPFSQGLHRADNF